MRVNTRYINSTRGTSSNCLFIYFIFAAVQLVGIIYLVFTRMSGESYRTCDSGPCCCTCVTYFQTLINSLVCWFCTSALGLVLFQIYFSIEIVWRQPGHTQSLAFRHLPLNFATTGYASEGAHSLFPCIWPPTLSSGFYTLPFLALCSLQIVPLV